MFHTQNFCLLSRNYEVNKRPSFQQLKYCLDHKDNRILGSVKRKVERSRSITFSHDSHDFTDQDINLTEQHYCKTE